jgi:NADPH:quinone reductase-like Zn-dependent oxidoreductase
MKAIVHYEYGAANVLRLEEIEKPIPAEDEALVRVHAASVNPADWYGMKGIIVARPGGGWLKPKDPRIGGDFAGVVEAVGSKVNDFKPGDEVYGSCHGALADYICVSKHISRKPSNISFEQTAGVPTAALTALQGLRDHGKLQAGQAVLITGAAGGVGHFAVQIAKAMGAEATAVCRTQNLEFVRSLGADHVVDYTHEDYTETERRYDLILDVASTKPWSALNRILKPNGMLILVGAPGANTPMGPLGQIGRLMVGSIRSRQKMRFFVARFNREDLAYMRDLIESGKMTPVIDSTHPIAEAVEAMRLLGEGHARGKIVVMMNAEKNGRTS